MQNSLILDAVSVSKQKKMWEAALKTKQFPLFIKRSAIVLFEMFNYPKSGGKLWGVIE